MTDTTDLAGLIREYGTTLYGNETPEETASQWIEALPGASLSHFQGWFDRGFWSPSVAGELFSKGVYPWEVPSDTVYDLCNGDLKVSVFLHAKGF